MARGNLADAGEIEVEVAPTPVSCGTGLNIVQSGLPAAIPLAMSCLGWQALPAQLATLVEPVISGRTCGASYSAGAAAAPPADGRKASVKQKPSPRPCAMNAGTAASTIFTEPQM